MVEAGDMFVSTPKFKLPFVIVDLVLESRVDMSGFGHGPVKCLRVEPNVPMKKLYVTESWLLGLISSDFDTVKV